MLVCSYDLADLICVLVLVSLDIEGIEASHAAESGEKSLAKLLMLVESVSSILVNERCVPIDSRALWQLAHNQPGSKASDYVLLTGKIT